LGVLEHLFSNRSLATIFLNPTLRLFMIEKVKHDCQYPCGYPVVKNVFLTVGLSEEKAEQVALVQCGCLALENDKEEYSDRNPIILEIWKEASNLSGEFYEDQYIVVYPVLGGWQWDFENWWEDDGQLWEAKRTYESRNEAILEARKQAVRIKIDYQTMMLWEDAHKDGLIDLNTYPEKTDLDARVLLPER